MKKTLLLISICLAFFATNCPADEEGISYKKLGEITPRSANDIASSNWSVGAETMDRDYTIYNHWKKYLGPLGVKKARLQAGWAKTEKEKSVYDFVWLDEIVFDMQKQGVEPWMCLCYGNPIYADGGGFRLGAGVPKTDEALAAWDRWVRATVTRYETVIDEWEVWNEPNLRGSNAAQVYGDFLIRTAETVRGVQPKAKILGLSIAGVNVEFASSVLSHVAERGKLDLLDEVTYHPYSFNPDSSYNAVQKLRGCVASFSPRIIIRQGENGAPSEYRKTKALSKYEWTELSQAKWALRRMLGDLGRDIPSSYFSIIDMKYPDEMNRKGLLLSKEDRTVERPKQAYYAVQNLAAVFDDTLERINDYEWLTNVDCSVSLFAYQKKDTKTPIVAIWFDAENPSDSNEKSRIDFRFESGNFEAPVYIDLRTGGVYEIPKSYWSKNGAEYWFKDIPCYDSPILIADRSALRWN